MTLETELKYFVSDFAPILERMERLGLSCTHWYFEENLVLDTGDGRLRSRDELLRIRKGQGGKITLKLPVDGADPSCKQRQEFESGVDNPDEIRIILSHLGFRPCLRYEKFRRICSLGETRICLDILPFGSFVELEGPQESFHGTAIELGLDSHEKTALNYHELHQEYQREHGLSPALDFVFEENQKKDLARKLNVKL
ncbi:class IV adenylate cyclase [Desulfonatronospira sp. MSAO_Bac3]|uniref:class IV adenylate cyclase n=1 Tax=Desulfonatronospira sp. MSAO_Bac3 TaxID=2293857 RepID=UPI000FF6EBC4|nr:class IV adenylate cyclase [Desulfonatronospira sp. MSAO_Bac3]RQD77711.1 MAG: CYTH domain-containing protein [Desulfonatronospira sp. MSAO_Bac3]